VCSSDLKQKESVAKSNLVVDSAATRLYSKLIIKIGKLKTALEKSKTENEQLYAEIDSLQLNVIKHQSSTIQLKGLERQFENIVFSNKDLIERIRIANEENKALGDSNSNIKSRLEVTANTLYNKEREYKILKKSIRFQVAGVKSVAYKHIRPLFRKPELVETKLAKDAEYIEITFVCVANDRVEKALYTLNVKLQGVGGLGITKPLEVNYVGIETPCSKTFNDPEAFQVGFHNIEISLNNEILYSGAIELK
jgi:hypothetical protein